MRHITGVVRKVYKSKNYFAYYLPPLVHPPPPLLNASTSPTPVIALFPPLATKPVCMSALFTVQLPRPVLFLSSLHIQINPFPYNILPITVPYFSHRKTLSRLPLGSPSPPLLHTPTHVEIKKTNKITSVFSRYAASTFLHVASA